MELSTNEKKQLRNQVALTNSHDSISVFVTRRMLFIEHQASNSLLCMNLRRTTLSRRSAEQLVECFRVSAPSSLNDMNIVKGAEQHEKHQ